MKTLTRFVPGFSIVAGILLHVTTAQGADRFWSGGAQSYNTPTNWTGGIVPTTADNAINDNGTNNVVQLIAGDPNWAVIDLRVGNTPGASGAFLQNGIDATLSGWLRLGMMTNSTAIYTLQSGNLNVNGSGSRLYIGETGACVFNMTGGFINHQVSGVNVIDIGDRALGGGSSGTVNHSGGTIASAGEIWIGNGVGGSGPAGVYNLSGTGVINLTNWLAIGRSGSTGILNIAGGTLNKGGSGNNITTGTGAAGNATINQSGGTINNTVSGTWLGEGGTTVWNMSGGVANLQVLQMGLNGAGKGIVNLTNGTISGTILTMGGDGTAQGYMNQYAGAVSASSGDSRFGGNATTGGNTIGIYNLFGGTLTLANNFQVGAYGSGQLNIAGGRVTSSGGFPDVGRFAGGFGVLDISSGGYNANLSSSLFIIGEAGTGTLNIRGGYLTNTATAAVNALSVGHVAGGVGIVNLNSGVLNTFSVGGNAAGNSTFNFNGGLLQARGNNTTFMSAFNNAYVRPGGAIIDVQGFNATIPQALLTPPGNGIASIPILTGGIGYTSAPIVKIGGGSGTNATAIAQMSGGIITNILITSPGANYVTAPTVTLVGGLPSTAATLSPAVLAPNTSGPLTKLGAGTLTLNGANTYDGLTYVSTGTLAIGNNSALGAIGNGTIVSNGATVRANSSLTVGEPLTLNTTAAGALAVGGNANLTLNGGITLNSGTTIHADGGSSFTINGNISGANVALTNDLNGSATSTINGAVSLGNGLFDLRGATLVLANNANSWSGGTLIESGTLQVGNGGANGSLGSGTITDNGTLAFNSASDFTIADTIQGMGGVTKSGSGKLTLATANTYIGATLVNAGTLALGPSGAIPNSSPITVNSNATMDASVNGLTLNAQTLGGKGVVLGNVTATAGSTIVPGGLAQAGTLVLSNNLILNNATNAFDLAFVTTEGGGTNDEILVAGNVTLNGVNTLAITPLSGSITNGRYVLVRYAGTLTGDSNNFAITYTVPQPAAQATVDTSIPGEIALVVVLGPTFTQPVVSNITSNSATLTLTITSDAGNGIDSYGTVYGLAPTPTGNPTFSLGPVTLPAAISNDLSGLTPGAHYYARGWASNAVNGIVYSLDRDFYAEPFAASGLSFQNISNSSLTVTWTPGVGSVGSVVVMREGSPIIWTPVDGSNYIGNASFGASGDLGSGTYLVYSGFGTSATVTTLRRGVNYTVAVYSFSGSGALINYQQLSPATTTQSTATNLVPEVAGELVIEMHSSRGLTLDVNGAVNEWANYGSVGGSFRNDGDTTTYPTYGVTTNRNAVIFDGGDRLKATFSAPKTLTGVNSNNVPENYSVEYWVLNPVVDSEEWVVTWARRGTSPRFAGFGYGTNNAFGATAHWAAPDMAFGEGIGTAGLASTPVAGVWHHIVATYDGAIERVYVDSILNAQETKALNIWDGDPVTLGWGLSSAFAYESTPFSGSLVGVRIHSQAMTALQISNNFAVGPDGVMPVTVPRIMNQPISRIVSETDSATFSLSAVGADPLSFQWYRNGSLISGGTNRTYTTAPLAVTDSGAQFVCVISNFFGGVPNVITSSVANLTVLSVANSLTHRWPFDANANDVVGTSHGTLMNGATISGGAAVLNNPGAPASSTLGQFVDLPNNLVMTYTSVTFEAWYTENGNGNWARIWDFGNSTGGEGFTGTGTNYLMATVPNGGDGGIRYGTRIGTTGEQLATYPVRPAQGTQHHVAVTHDGVNQVLKLYVDGALVATTTSASINPPTLGSTLNDWLGRSQFSGDAYFNGNIAEFRTYNTALSATKIQQNFELGPNQPPSSGPVVVWKNPANATTIENRPVTFTADVNGNVPMTFQWYKNGTALSGATNLTLTFSPSLADDTALITMRATNVVGGVTNNAESTAATLTVLADTNAPIVVGAANAGATTVVVGFSEVVNASLANNTATYTLSGPGGAVAISGATLQADGVTVLLTTAPIAIGSSYTLTVNGITDIAWTPNLLSPNPTIITFYTSPLSLADIGSSGTAGHIYGTTNGLRIVADGKGIGGTSDQLSFAYQAMNGDFDVQVRLGSVSLSDTWASAGLMARETLDASSKFAASFGTPSIVGSYFESRATAGGQTVTAGNFPANYPNSWLRLQRVGNQFTGYASYDGQAWTVLSSATITASNTLFVGLAVSSHNPSQTTTADFADFGNTVSTTVGTVPNTSEVLGPSTRRTGLVLSEIMYKPATRADLKNVEFVEIYNSNPFLYDLSGHRVSGDIDYTFPNGTIIQAGQFLVVAKVPTDVQSVYGISGVFGPYTGSLKTSGTVRVRSEIDAVLLEVNYDNNAPWPVAADGTGHSLVLARPSYGENDARAWDISDVTGGSPGAPEAYRPSALRNVVINEVFANSNDPLLEDFVELYNHSNASNVISGCVLTDNASTNKFIVPNGTVIPPHGFVSFGQAQLGFGLKSSGDNIYFKNPTGSRVLDVVKFDSQADGVSLGRWPDGASAFYVQSSRTPAAANAGPRNANIVINELMYHPISGNDGDQYIEIYNKGTNAVSLAGWKFTAGITFSFPNTATIAPDSYVLVAANATNLFAKYPNLNSANTFGNFSGKLSHGGERVVLSMPEYNITTNNHGAFVTNTIYVAADEVTYGTGGRWGQWADGGGSSLELIDSRADRRLAANWADSDESSKSSWTNIEWTGLLDNGSLNNATLDYIQLGILDAGESLVDNVEIVNTNGLSYLSNGDFEAGSIGWLFTGDHIRSSIDVGAGFGGSGNALHLRTANRIWTIANAVSGTLTNTSLTAGQVATLRFKARWLHGWPEVLLRLHGNFGEATGALPLPANLGTPGARNSVAVTNAGPAVYEVTHQPALPVANQPVVVIARASDPDGVASLVVNYRIDPSATVVSAPMNDAGTNGDGIAGDGIYSTTIPGQASGVLIGFNVAATDSLGAGARFPALLSDNTPTRECLVRFGEPNPTSSFGTYHLWISQANLDRWNSLPDLSNEDMDLTWVYNGRVIYNALGRYGGSPYHQSDRGAIENGPNNGPSHLILEVPKDDLLLGYKSFNKVAWPGNDIFDDTGSVNNNDSTLQREQAANMLLRGLGQPWVYRRFVGVYVNGTRRGQLMEDALRPHVSVPDVYYPDEKDGYVYKIQPWFEGSRTNAVDGSTPWANKEWAYYQPFYTTNNGVVSHKTPRYRWHYEVRETPGSANDFTNVFRLVEAGAASASSNFVSIIENVADMENWMRLVAANHAAGNWDCWGVQNAQNIYGYVSPTKRWTMFMFDFNIVMGNRIAWTPGQNLFVTPPAFGLLGADTNWANIMNTPKFRRMYLRALKELANGAMTPAQFDATVDAKYQAIVANGLNATDSAVIKSWVASARLSILNQINPLDSTVFGPTTNMLATGSNVIAITGFAPVEVTTITLNGVEMNPNWLTPTSYSITLPVLNGVTNYTMLGWNRFGQLVSGASNQVQVINSGTPESPIGSVVINEIMFTPSNPDAEYVELFNNSFTSTFDLSGWQVNGLSYTFPANSVIRPRNFLVLTKSRTEFANTYGVFVPVFDDYEGGNLQGDGETLSLIIPGPTNTLDVIVDQVRYEAVAPWPATAAGTSLQLIDSTQDNSRSGNWAALIPTPAAANATNTALPAFPALWLNEVQANNLTGITDVLGHRNPWVEIYNASTNTVSLDNLFLTDTYTNLAKWAFPSNVTLSPGQFYVVFCDADTFESTPTELHTSFRLASGSGSVALTRLVGGQPQVVDYLNYKNIPVNNSYGDYPNGQPFYRQAMFYPTPRATNDASLPPVVLHVNEWMASNTRTLANPVGGKYDDWFELFNPNDFDVNLQNWSVANSTTNPTQFIIPAGYVVPAHGHFLIWADSQAAQNSTNRPELHISFKLSKSGEVIGLFAPNRRLVDSISFGTQTDDVSQGRSPDGSTNVMAQPIATPGTTNYYNHPPVIAPIADQVIPELSPFTLTIPWSDEDSGQNHIVVMAQGPAGSVLTNGVFGWTPTEAQGPNDYIVKVVVFDSGVPSQSATQTFHVIVSEVNIAPVLTLGSSVARAIYLGETLTFTNTASDADLPAQTLSFSVEVGPTNANIDAITGLFSFTPVVGQAGLTNVITLRVTDNGPGTLSQSKTVQVFVASKPALANISRQGNNVQFQFGALTGRSYQVYYTDDLTGSWQPLGAPRTSNDGTITVNDSTGAAQRFYKVEVVP